jgi:hypothetical protein
MAQVRQGTLSHSPPRCGEGAGVGVDIGSLCWDPPSLTLPRKGGGNGKSVSWSGGGDRG